MNIRCQSRPGKDFHLQEGENSEWKTCRQTKGVVASAFHERDTADEEISDR